jgi:ribosome biogenesis protein Tsr3
MNEKQRILEAYKEMLDEATMGPIEGNWKKVASVFQSIFSQLRRLEKIGAYKDKTYGKRIKKLDEDLEELASDLDDEFGG